MKIKKIIIWSIVGIFIILLCLLLIGFLVSIGTEFSVSADNDLFWMTVLSLALAISVYIYMKGKKKEKNKDDETQDEQEKYTDYRQVSKQALDKAQELFEEKKYKDAYSTASWALRYFISNNNNIKTELTSYETIKLLKTKKKEHKQIKKALDLCSLVEFAKYRPNEKDFKRIMVICRKVIHDGRQ